MISVGVHGIFRVHGTTPEELERDCKVIMDTLLALEKCDGNVSDGAVSTDLAERIVEIEVVGHGQTFEQARRNAESAVRSAIHKTGGGTSGIVSDNFATQALNAELVDA